MMHQRRGFCHRKAAPRLILILGLLLFAFVANAQVYQRNPARFQFRGGIFDSTFRVPYGSTPKLNENIFTNTPAALFWNTSDSSLYGFSGWQWIKIGSGPSNAPFPDSLSNLLDVNISYPTIDGSVLKWNGTSGRWEPAPDQTGAGGGGIIEFNGSTVSTQSLATGTSGNDFGINTNTAGGVHTFNIPTVSGTARGLVTSSLFNTWNGKIGPGDTASMLANYKHWIAGYVKSSDTAAMLNNYRHWLQGYLKAADIVGKLNISDTSSMLTNYKHWLQGYLTAETDPSAVKITGNQTGIAGDKTWTGNLIVSTSSGQKTIGVERTDYANTPTAVLSVTVASGDNNSGYLSLKDNTGFQTTYMQGKIKNSSNNTLRLPDGTGLDTLATQAYARSVGGSGSSNNYIKSILKTGSDVALVNDTLIADQSQVWAYQVINGRKGFYPNTPDTVKLAEQIRMSTFNSVFDLMNSNYHNTGFRRAFTAGYAAAGDGGNGVYQWVDTSTQTHDTAFAIKPWNVTGAGRWLYVPHDNKYNFLALGAKGDNSTDNLWAWRKFHNKMSRSQSGPILVVPNGSYVFTSGIEQTKPFDVVGSQSSTFIFPKQDTGVYFHGSMYGITPTWRSMRVNAYEKDTTDGKVGGVKSYSIHDYKYHGIVVTTIVNFHDVIVRNFSGHAWRFYGSVEDLQVAIKTAGTGYTDGVYNDRIMSGGSGTEMNLQITVTGGAVTNLVVSGPGSHYLKGDILTAPTLPGGSGFTAEVLSEPSNVSGARLYNCGAEKSTGAGFAVSGPDANKILLMSLDLRENSLVGIYDSSFLGIDIYSPMGHLNGYLSGPGWGHYRIGLNPNARTGMYDPYGEENGVSTSYVGGQSKAFVGMDESGYIGPGLILRNNSFNGLLVEGETRLGGTNDAGAFDLQVDGPSFFKGNIQQGSVTNPDFFMDGDASSYTATFRIKAGAVGANAISGLSTSEGLTISSYSSQVFTVSNNNGSSYTEAMRLKSTNGQLKLPYYATGTTLTGTANKFAAFDVDGNVIAVDPPSGSGGEANTMSSVGGGLQIFNAKSGVDFPMKSLNASHFDLSTNIIEIDAALITNISNGQTAFGWGNHASAGYITSNQSITLSGDISGTGSTAITTAIGANKVTNAMLATMPTASFKGRTTAATGNVEDLTATQATAMLDVFTSGLKGVVPASGGGTTNFLRADGTWAAPPGGGSASLTQHQIGIGDASNILSGNSGFTYNISTGRFMVGYTASIDNSWLHQIKGSLWVGSSTAMHFGVDDNANAFAKGDLEVGGLTNSNKITVKSLAGTGSLLLQTTNAESYIRAEGDLHLGSNASNSRLILTGTEARFVGSLRVAEVAAPATPAANQIVIYGKSDGKVYSKDDAGNEYDLTAVGAGGGEANTTSNEGSTSGRVGLAMTKSGVNLPFKSLVAGTNITFDESVTGEVEINASGSGAVWGGITGTLADQSDLQTALNAKQATLVSGTNIKTINGSSVLGSGDLVVGGGDAYLGNTQTFTGVNTFTQVVKALEYRLPNYSTIPSGLFDEVSGEVISLAINTPQIGTRDNARVGGIFRLDSRPAEQRFVIYGYATGGSTAADRFSVNLENGNVKIPALAATSVDEMVTIDNTGLLKKQAIPGGATPNWNTVMSTGNTTTSNPVLLGSRIEYKDAGNTTLYGYHQVESDGDWVVVTNSGGTRGFNVVTSGLTAVRNYTFPDANSTILSTDNAVTVTNKRNTKRSGTVASSATPTINTDNIDFYSITALSTAITSFSTNLTGTPTEGQTLWIAITDNGTARAITWGALFEASGTVALPTTTVISTRLDVGFVWNSVTSKWRCIAAQ